MTTVEPAERTAAGSAAPAPRRFTVDEYHLLVGAGILHEEEHVELLEGVIAQMSPQQERHMKAMVRLTRWLSRALPDSYEVRPQGPLTLLDSEPEPHLAVVLADRPEGLEQHPRSALLVVEVSGSSLALDRSVKARIYARAGIPEYWMVNLHEQYVEVHRDSDASAGRFRTILTVRPGEVLAPGSLPGLSIPVASLFD